MTGRARRGLAAALVVPGLALGACSSGVAEEDSSRDPAPTSEPTTTGATRSDAGGPGPGFGAFDAQLAAELTASTDQSPFFMVNLIAFRDLAEYADGRKTDLTGEEANDLYTATGVQVLLQAGMRPALVGNVNAGASPRSEPAWDQVGIARYPSYADFFATTADPEFRRGVEHKDAGVETSSVIVTHRVADGPRGDELPPATDPVVLFEIFSHDGTGTSRRPDTLARYLDDLEPRATSHGAISLGTYEVVGTLIGDGREWDEAHLWWFPDRAGLDALLADDELADLTAARNADLTDRYRLVLDGVLVEPRGREP